MISCTEFIPCYSELFTFLEEKHGRDEVDRFWEFLFTPNGEGIPLINFVKKEGLRGCWDYWKGSLNEEAADFTMYFNDKRGFFLIEMHHCPSKGRLLQLKDDLGIEPYHDYCLHCDHYRESVAQAGLDYIYNFNGIDHASCSTLITNPEIFDGRIIMDEDTEIMDRKAADNEYFHRDFHSSMNMGIEYLGANYGKEEVEEFLARYTEHVYQPVLAAVKKNGLSAVQDKIMDTYRKEKALDAVEFSQGKDFLNVTIHYCPAVKYLRETGRKVSSWYPYTTLTVMKTIAKAGGFDFKMENYDPETGAAKYSFYVI